MVVTIVAPESGIYLVLDRWRALYALLFVLPGSSMNRVAGQVKVFRMLAPFITYF